MCLALSASAWGQDVFASQGQPEQGGVVISVTDFYNGNCDVKIKSLRTGYIHSVTIRCMSSLIPYLNTSSDSDPPFNQAVKNCLNVIKTMAATEGPTRPINRLLNELKNVPVTIHPRPKSDTSNATPYSPPGQRVNITWSPIDAGTYPEDGADKIPCATLLHELTHAWENYNGLENGELQAVRAENWFIWKSNGKKQRTRYVNTPLPQNQVVWPQAAN